jgi:hypothetical protein
MADPLERLRNPKPGGAIAAARDYGIDLTLIMERLRCSPDERVRDLQQAMADIEEMRQAFRQSHDTT